VKMATKWIELFRALVPHLSRAALVQDPTSGSAPYKQWRSSEKSVYPDLDVHSLR